LSPVIAGVAGREIWAVIRACQFGEHGPQAGSECGIVRPAPRHRDHRGVQGDRHLLSELAGIRYDPGDPRRSDIDLWQREITVRGKGGKDRIVKIGHQAARSLDRYLRARSRHAQAWRPQLWLGAGHREPLTAAGI
jgi:integrase